MGEETDVVEDTTDDEPTWKAWSLSRWRKHESEVQTRRSVVIDIANTDKSLPPRGDEERGWRKHWRRGLVGSIQDWAEGSKFRVIFMIAEMARYFEVQREVDWPSTLASHRSPSPPTSPPPPHTQKQSGHTHSITVSVWPSPIGCCTADAEPGIHSTVQ